MESVGAIQLGLGDMEDFVLSGVMSAGGPTGGQPGSGNCEGTNEIWLWDVGVDETRDEGGGSSEQRETGDEGVHYECALGV